MLRFSTPTYRIKFVKNYRILKEDGKNLFPGSNYNLTRTIDEITTVPEVGDQVTIHTENSLLEEKLGTVEKRQIFLHPKGSKDKIVFQRPDYLITLKTRNFEISGQTFNDIDLEDIHGIWCSIFYRGIGMNKFSFVNKLGKSEWELWDGWVEEFVNHGFFPFDECQHNFSWDKDTMGFKDE